jgi:cytosine/adenosine deaminase-related metal-dependent hydrolase
VFSRVVYAAQSRDVRHVFVNGAALLRDGELTTLRLDEVLPRSRAQARALVARAGIADLV